MPRVDQVAIITPHTPALHDCPAGHATPHAPQFVTLDRVSTHVPAQRVDPAAQGARHMPATQLSSTGHGLPHRPQCTTLVIVSVHTPVQRICPAPHATSGASADGASTTTSMAASAAVSPGASKSVASPRESAPTGTSSPRESIGATESVPEASGPPSGDRTSRKFCSAMAHAAKTPSKTASPSARTTFMPPEHQNARFDDRPPDTDRAFSPSVTQRALCVMLRASAMSSAHRRSPPSRRGLASLEDLAGVVALALLASLSGCPSSPTVPSDVVEDTPTTDDVRPLADSPTLTDAQPDALSTTVTCRAGTSARPIPDAITQAVLVTTPAWTSASGNLDRFERTPGGMWTSVGARTPVSIGRSGLGWGRGLHGSAEPDGCDGPTKSEGDGRSPAGVFTIGTVYGDTPGAGSFPYTVTTSSWRCPDDPASMFYNQVLDANTVTPDWNSAELMVRTDGLYRWVVFVNHNTSPRVPRGGSCIFLHVWGGATVTTSGCTSMSRTALEGVLPWLRPAQAVYIALPAPVYATVRDVWRLP